MISAVIALDPTPRRLPSMEKYRRSMRLVTLCAEALHTCAQNATDGGAQNLLQQADQLKTKRMKETVTNELSESRLSLAEDLWRARISSCKTPPAQDDPVGVIMNTLIAQ